MASKQMISSQRGDTATSGQQSQVSITCNVDTSLEELFRVVQHGSNSVPWALRNMPNSFFRPPSASSSATHSRESSLDASSMGGFSPKQQQQQIPSGGTVAISGVSIGKPPTPSASNSPHSAAASPPLILQAGLSSQQQQQQQLQQHPINSLGQLNLNDETNKTSTTIPPPPISGLAIVHSRAHSAPGNLRQNFTIAPNQINVNTQQTFGIQHNQHLQQQQMPIAVEAVQNYHVRQHSYDLHNIQLPDGWSIAYTEHGDRYFLNHKDKTTTWEDPRTELLKRESNTLPNSLSLINQLRRQQAIVNNGNNNHNTCPPVFSSQPMLHNNNHAHHQRQRSHQLQGQSVSSSQNLQSVVIDSPNLPLPDGWDQLKTIKGDIYYVNHNDKTTQWYHPSLLRQVQLNMVKQKQLNSGLQPPPYPASVTSAMDTSTTGANIPPELVTALENMNTTGRVEQQQQQQAQSLFAGNQSSIVQQQNSNLRVNQLQLERERYRQRQEELMQNSMLKANYLRLNNSPNNNVNSQSSEAVDPFLSSTVNTTTDNNNTTPAVGNHHVRHQSHDSGLTNVTTNPLFGGSELTLNNFHALNNQLPVDSDSFGSGGSGTTTEQSQFINSLLESSQFEPTINSLNVHLNFDQSIANLQQSGNHSQQQLSQPVDDLFAIDSNDLAELDMDTLEDLLNNNNNNNNNSNRDNSITWLR